MKPTQLGQLLRLTGLLVAGLLLITLHACGGGDGGSGAAPDPTPPPPFQPHVNDTGVTTCGNAITNNSSCPVATYTDQDGDLGRDANPATNSDSDGKLGFSFTKLDIAGQPLSADATAWSCVRDEVTGLAWENKASNKGLHDGGARFSWGDGLDQSTCYFLSKCGTNELVTAVNTEKLCGFTDWRLPKMEELHSIAYYANPSTTLFLLPDYFPNYEYEIVSLIKIKQNYWSASAFAADTSKAWATLIQDGSIQAYAKGQDLGVRLVRGGTPPGGTVTANPYQVCDPQLAATAPDSRYTDNKDGTVTDKQTALMWARCPMGYTFSDNSSPDNWSDDNCTSTATISYTWQGALQAVATSNGATGFAGHKDWRMPNIKEIYSLTEHRCRVNAMNMAAFPADTLGIVWSSTPVLGATEIWGYEKDWGSSVKVAKTVKGALYLVRNAD